MSGMSRFCVGYLHLRQFYFLPPLVLAFVALHLAFVRAAVPLVLLAVALVQPYSNLIT